MSVDTMPRHVDTAAGRVAAVERAIEAMKAGIDRPLPLSDIASCGGYSPYHFHRVFREITSVTPGRFLAALRMAAARRLLLHRSMTVAEIGLRVGYTSLGTFTTQFAKLTGLPPARFRALARSFGDELISDRLPAVSRAVCTGRGPLVAPLALPEPESLIIGRFFVAGNLEEHPGLSALASGPPGVRFPEAPVPALYTAFLVVVPGRVRLVDAFVRDVPGSYIVGHAKMSLAAGCPPPATVGVVMRHPRPTDLPVLAVTSVRWLAQLAS